MFKINIKATTLRFDQKKFAIEADKKIEALFHGAARAFLIAAVRRIPVRTGFLRGAFTTLEDAVGSFDFKSAKIKGLPTRKPKVRGTVRAKLPSKALQKLEARRTKALLQHEKLMKRISALRANALERGKISKSFQALLDKQTRFNKMRGNIALQVARVRGGIRGRNLEGGFRTRPGEKIRSITRLTEYYYPSASKAGRVLKTPRSGRQFSTPPKEIITKGKSTITKSASTGRWTFKYSVDIKYFPINEVELAWFAWASGVIAFNQYMQANFAAQFPDVNKFFIKEQVGRQSRTSGNLARS